MRLLKDVQILSALIWAATILVSSVLVKDSNIVTLLLTAAGFHVVLLSQMLKRKNTACSKI